MSSTPDQPLFETLGIVGVGLLGGSLALAARARGLVRSVTGVGRDLRRMDEACAAGLLDRGATEITALAEADLIVVCTPVDRVAADVLAAAAVSSPAAVITDVGSTKRSIVQSVETNDDAARKFVPAHPLAGSEQRGWEAADANLFQSRTCVLTPTAKTDPQRLDRVDRFWRALGMLTRRLTPAEHDEILATTSHVPHVVAAALTRLIDEQSRPFTATGFRDTTRIAGGDASIWTPILLQNSVAVSQVIGRLLDELHRVQQSVREGNAPQIQIWLEEARRERQQLDRRESPSG